MNDFNNTLPEQAFNMRLAQTGPLLIAGLCEPLSAISHETIPILWQQLAKRGHDIPNRVDSIGYGLCLHSDNNSFYYMAGYAVWDFSGMPLELNQITLPGQTFAVFPHSGHVMHIRQTINTVFDEWLPNSGYTQDLRPGNSVYFFERYGEGFNPETGLGDIEIWLPVKR